MAHQQFKVIEGGRQPYWGSTDEVFARLRADAAALGSIADDRLRIAEARIQTRLQASYLARRTPDAASAILSAAGNADVWQATAAARGVPVDKFKEAIERLAGIHRTAEARLDRQLEEQAQEAAMRTASAVSPYERWRVASDAGHANLIQPWADMDPMAQFDALGTEGYGNRAMAAWLVTGGSAEAKGVSPADEEALAAGETRPLAPAGRGPFGVNWKALGLDARSLADLPVDWARLEGADQDAFDRWQLALREAAPGSALGGRAIVAEASRNGVSGNLILLVDGDRLIPAFEHRGKDARLCVELPQHAGHEVARVATTAWRRDADAADPMMTKPMPRLRVGVDVAGAPAEVVALAAMEADVRVDLRSPGLRAAVERVQLTGYDFGGAGSEREQVLAEAAFVTAVNKDRLPSFRGGIFGDIAANPELRCRYKERVADALGALGAGSHRVGQTLERIDQLASGPSDRTIQAVAEHDAARLVAPRLVDEVGPGARPSTAWSDI